MSHRFAIPAAIIFLAANALAAEQQVKREALPPAVVKTFDAYTQGATNKMYSMEMDAGHRVYEATTTVNGRTRTVEAAEDGKLNEIEEEVAMNNLPQNVQDGLKAQAKGATIRRVESITKNEKLVAYEAAISRNGKKGEVQVGPDGTKLDHEE